MHDDIILGIDPGFSITGIAILKKQNNNVGIVAAGYISYSSKKSITQRIAQFHQEIEQLILDKHITTIALETSFLGKNAQTFLKLGYLRGIVHLLAAQHKLRIYEFSPRQVKQAVTGFGGASKVQVASALQMLFPHLPTPKKEDVTDALAISLCGAWSL